MSGFAYTHGVRACQGGGGERQTPLAARIRELTEEERTEAAAREQAQPEVQAPPREEDGMLPPLSVQRHGDCDSNSTGSTNSTERSIHHPSNSDMSKHASAALQAKLAMDALERRDYELLALITQSANGNDAAAVDKPGGPRAPGTPTRPAGTAAYVSDQSRPRTSAFRNVEQLRTRGTEGTYVRRVVAGGCSFRIDVIDACTNPHRSSGVCSYTPKDLATATLRDPVHTW